WRTGSRRDVAPGARHLGAADPHLWHPQAAPGRNATAQPHLGAPRTRASTVSTLTHSPLVYSLRNPLRDAERLLPGRVLENEVARALEQGHATAGVRPKVFGDGWVAHLRRRPSPLRRDRLASVVV